MTEATQTVSQSVDSAGNSSYADEIRYTPGVGLFDGTTCDSWPAVIDYVATGQRAEPLATALSRFLEGTPKSYAETIRTRMARHDITSAVVIGTKYGFRYRKVLGIQDDGVTNRRVMFDPVARVGYVVDADRLCTKDDIQHNRCAVEDLVIDGTTIKTLYRKQARTDSTVPTLLVVASYIQFLESAKLDVNVILATATLFGGQDIQQGEDLSTRAGEIDIEVLPYLKPGWRDALSAAVPGFFLAVASKTGGIRNITSQVSGARNIVIGDSFGAGAPPLGEVRVGLSELLGAGQAEWRRSPESDYKVSPDPACGTVGGYQMSAFRRAYSATATFASKVPVRKEAASGGTAIVLAGKRNTDLTVSAPGADAPTAQISVPAIERYVTKFFDEKVNTGTWERQPYARTDQTCIKIGQASPWLNEPEYSDSCRNINTPDCYCQLCNIAQKIDIYFGDERGTTVYRDSWGSSGPGISKYMMAQSINYILGQLYDATLQSPAPASAANGVARRWTNVDAASSSAQLFTQGLLFDQMYQRDFNAGLRSGLPSAGWSQLAEIASESALINVLSSSYRSAARLKPTYGIDPERWKEAQGWAHIAEIPSMNDTVKLNALGMPYGDYLTGWCPARSSASSNSQSRSFDDLRERWSQVADLVTDFNTVAANQNQQGQISEVEEKLASSIDIAKGFLSSVETIGTDLADGAGANIKTQQGASNQLTSVADNVERDRQQLEEQIRNLWECWAPDDLTVCVANMATMLHQLEQQCIEEDKQPHYCGIVLDNIAKVVPLLQPAAKILNSDEVRELNEAVVEAIENNDKPSADGMQLLDRARDNAERWGSNIQEPVRAFQAIADIVEQGIPACGDSTLRAEAQTRLTQLAALNSVMKLYATSLESLAGILASIQGTIQHGMVTQHAFQALSSSAQAARTSMNALPTNAHLVTDLNQRAQYLQAACRATLAANHAMQSDLFHTSQLLQSSTGAASTTAMLTVPEEPIYLGSDRSMGTKKGFLMSLWDPALFTARASLDGTLPEQFLGIAKNRFSRFVNEVQSPDVSDLPQTGFVVRKVIAGAAIDQLRTAGAVDVSLTLDDLVEGGNAAPSQVTAIGATADGTNYVPLAAPVVLGVRYVACTGTGSDPCCPTCRRELASNPPAIMRRTGALVPTLTCPATTVSHGTAEPQHARARTCLKPVQTPLRSWELQSFQAQATNDNLFEQAISALDVSTAAIAWDIQRGLPALGAWTVARDRTAANQLANGNAIPAGSFDSGVTGLELAFVLAAEPQSQTGAKQAYITERCRSEIADNGVDDNCDGVVDENAIPKVGRFEGEPSGGWTTNVGGLGLSRAHTQGATSLVVAASGPGIELTSPVSSASNYSVIGNRLLLDVYVPTAMTAGSLGIEMHVDGTVLSMGSRSLTSLPAGAWSTLSFTPPSNLGAELTKGSGIFAQFVIKLNTPRGSAFLSLDNLRFGGRLVKAEDGASARGTLAELLSFETPSDWTGTGGTITFDGTAAAGSKAVKITGHPGFVTLASAPFLMSERSTVPKFVTVGVRTAKVLEYGQALVSFRCPLYRGSATLKGRFAGPGIEWENDYHWTSMAIPAEIQTAMGKPNSECALTVQIAAPPDSQITVDNVSFADQIYSSVK